MRPSTPYILLSLVLLSGCVSSVRFQEDASDYEQTIAHLTDRIEEDAQDAAAQRDLGTIYLRTNQFGKALPHLERAYALVPNDPATTFYYGLALETNGQQQAALDVYGRYPEVARLSEYRRLMAGRYQRLIRMVTREEIRARLASEEDYQSVPPRTIAIFPFAYQGGNPRYTPLGRGLAEMLAVDLSHVDDLEVLERVRVQALIDETELTLGRDPAVDPATAPRAGRLLGARRLVTGTYDVLPGDLLRLDASAYTSEAEALALDSRSDDLSNLFALQKDLTFALLGELGIEPTRAEREAIERVPTRDLQAFLAYCRGLEAEEAGRYGEAATHFREARQRDPEFEQAKVQAEMAEATLETSRNAETLAAFAGGEELAPTTKPDPTRGRHEQMNDTIGSGYVPGEDSREPAAEAADAGATRLPDPPSTPQRGN